MMQPPFPPPSAPAPAGSGPDGMVLTAPELDADALGMGMPGPDDAQQEQQPRQRVTALDYWAQREFQKWPDELESDGELSALSNWVMDEAEWGRTHYAARDERMMLDQRTFALTTSKGTLGHDEKDPKEKEAAGVQEIILPDPYVVTVKIVSMLVGAGLRFNMPARSVLDTNSVQMVENFLSDWWGQFRRLLGRGSGGDPLRRIAHFLVLRGWAAVLLLPNSDDRSRSFPWRVRVEDPLQVYPRDNDDGEWDSCTHQYSLTARNAIQKYPEVEEAVSGYKDGEYVTCVAYYDRLYHCIVLQKGNVGGGASKAFAGPGDRMVIKRAVPHGVTDLKGTPLFPWIIQLAMGDLSAPVGGVNGSVGSGDQNDTKMAGPGVLFAVHEWYTVLCEVLSMLLTNVATSVNPPTIEWIREGAAAPERISLLPGARNTKVFYGHDVQVLDTAPNPGNLQPLLTILQDARNKSLLPAVSYGEGGSIQSGYGIGLLQGPAHDMISPFKNAVKGVVESVMQRVLEITGTVTAETVGTVRITTSGGLLGQRRSGTDFDPALIHQTGTQVDVQFGEITPQDKAALMAYIGPMVAAQMLSRFTALQEMGYQDPLLEMQRVALQDIMQNPAAALMLADLSVFANEKDLIEALVQLNNQMQAQQAQQAQTGASPAPGGASPSAGGQPLPTSAVPLEAQAGESGRAGMPPSAQNPAEQTQRAIGRGISDISGGSPAAR